MADTLRIELDDATVQRAFARLRRIGQDSAPMFGEIAEHLLESTQARFRDSVAPDGTPWAPIHHAQRRPLLDTGTLRDQIFPRHGADYAEIAASAAYARYHQEGTGPYVILPRTKRALAFPGAGGATVVRGRVNHPGITARPFIGLSARDWVDIRAMAAAYIEHEFESAAR